MKKIIFLIGIAGLFTFITSFKAPPAEVFSGRFEFDYDITVLNACNNESIQVIGSELHTHHGVLNNNRVNYNFHARSQATAVGSLGNRYIINAFYNGAGTAILINGAFVYNLIWRVDFISQGNAPSFHRLIKEKVTVIPNGRITVEILEDNANCY